MTAEYLLNFKQPFDSVGFSSTSEQSTEIMRQNISECYKHVSGRCSVWILAEIPAIVIGLRGFLSSFLAMGLNTVTSTDCTSLLKVF
jgi:hypothetical protein